MGKGAAVHKSSAGQIRMSDWAHLKTELYWVYEGKVNVRFRTQRQDEYKNHPAYLIRKGTLTVQTESGTVTGHAGDWVLPGDTIVGREFSDDAEILSIRFAIDWPDGKPCLDWDATLVFASADFPELEEKAVHMLEIIKGIMPEPSPRFLFSRGDLRDHLRIRENYIAWLRCLMEIIGKISHSSLRLERMDERVFEAARLMDRHPLDMEFNDKDLADAVHLSVSQLDRLFSKEFGQTPKQYLDSRRIERAKDQLRRSSIPIKQLAFDLGFNSLSYFSRWFSAKTGKSPREFRQSYK